MFVLTLATAIIGFFLARLVHSVDKMNDNFLQVAQTLSAQTQINGHLTDKYSNIEDKIEKISLELNNIQGRLITIETRHHEPY